MNRNRLLTLAAAAGLALAGASAAYVYVDREALRGQVQAASGVGGPFRLASSNGGLVDSEALAGKPYGVFFGYTHCPEVCPTTMFEMSRALQALGDDAKDFRLFFITVDPERDTAPLLKDYLANFDPRIEALVPTLEELPKVASAFRVFYQKAPQSDGGYAMDHTASLFLFARDGTFAGFISFNDGPERRLEKLRKVLAEQ